ncbi:MAG: type II and III secretion system protein [Alphaproteobacteria bacterium BRH_c36]|nr:MAG: type II and III secretion system protein [Alphaproteobacteria bacterium BRH_c36]
MYDRTSKNWGVALAAILTLILAGFGIGMQPAEAQSLRGGYEPAEAPGPMNHHSLIRVPDKGGLPYSKNIRIGLGKSVLIEFPRDVRDVMVSNPQAVDAVVLSSNRVFLLARRIGEANAFFFDHNGEQFATLELFVERETAGLQEMLNRLIPGGKIAVEMINQTVVLTGHVRNPADAARAANIAKQFVTVEFETKGGENAEGTAVKSFEKTDSESVVINLLQVEGEEQVMLRVVVAEVQRSMLKQFGINLGAQINSGNFSTGILTENSLPLTTAEGLGSLAVPGVATALAGAPLRLFNSFGGSGGSDDTLPFGNSGIAGGWGTGNQSAAYTMRALERNGLIKTLAEPNLTAVSGETANFLAGGEFPIPVVDAQGQTSVIFKEFGVGVAFTPNVMSEGRISLKIETEVSELSNQGAVQIGTLQIPAIKTRRANSTVELPSGGSLAIAGLLSEDTRQNIDGLPGLKDVPIIGTLFRSRDFIKRETELVVIVTPYVVRPTARRDLARPGDGLGDATDMKANFLGHMNRIYGRGTAIPDGGLKGDYGFIVE